LKLVRTVSSVLDSGGEVGVEGEVVNVGRVREIRERVGEARESHELVAGRGLGGHCY
jgi:hypothetical protein